MKPSSKYEAFVKMASHVKLSFFIEKMKKIAKPLFKCEEFIKKRKEKEESLSPRLAMYRGQRAVTNKGTLANRVAAKHHRIHACTTLLSKSNIARTDTTYVAYAYLTLSG
jgi:hypothetical protein